MAFSEFDDGALAHRLFQTERDLVSARFRHSMTQLENTSTLRVLRRDIARMKFEMGNRELSQGLAKNTLIDRSRASFRASEDAAPVASKGGFLSGVVDKLAGKE